jgi:uncharacterized protein YegL
LQSDYLNPAFRHQLLTIVADKSGSMIGPSINEVNDGTALLARTCREDLLTRDSLHVQLVTFGESIQVYPFTPITRFNPPPMVASGRTPMAEALLEAVPRTERYRKLLWDADVEVLKPLYFVFSDGCPTSLPDMIAEATACVAQVERTRRGAFYAFGVDELAVAAMRPFFPRPVHLLPGADFLAFFRIISLSLQRVSSGYVSEDYDLTSDIDAQLQIPYEGKNHGNRVL